MRITRRQLKKIIKEEVDNWSPPHSRPGWNNLTLEEKIQAVSEYTGSLYHWDQGDTLEAKIKKIMNKLDIT